MAKDLAIPTFKKIGNKDSPKKTQLSLRLSNLTFLQKQIFLAPHHENL